MEPRRVDTLLIGGGVAAARCARALRRTGFAGSILLVGDEATLPYNRPPLSKEMLRDDLPDELVLAEQPSWYERRGVELLLGTPATSLDPGERLVELTDGRRLRYGSCLLATGAEPLRPSIPGAGLAMPLRTLADARAIRGRALAGGRAVVIGGGFIGLEVAASLAILGMRVTVLELGGELWGGALGSAVSAWAMERLSVGGVEVRTSCACTAVRAGGVLIGRERLAADLVVAGVGVRPRVALADAAGLELDDGVVVDDRQATSEDGLFAAGDVARPRNGMRVEHWHAARESGERAASGMLGLEPSSRRAPWVFSEFAGSFLDVVGSASDEDTETMLGPGLVAWLRGGRLTQVAVMDHAFPVEQARLLVERSAPAVDVTRQPRAPRRAGGDV